NKKAWIARPLPSRAGHVQAAAEQRVVGEEVVDLPTGGGIDDANVWAAARSRNAKDAGGSARGGGQAGDADTTREVRVVGEEVGELTASGAVENRDIRPAAGAG